jgi:hypothetical protein
MSLLVPWLVFPLVLASVSLGCGLLLERLSASELPAALLIPGGIALVIVAAEFATMTSATASFATPLVVALAVAGWGLSVPWQRARLDPFALAAAAGAFAALAAPVILSGSATFTGYIKLDDTATWLALTDRVMAHGHDLTGLAPSTYRTTLEVTLAKGYPFGAFLPMGVGRALTAENTVWVFQPYLAFLGGSLALCLYALAAPLVRSRSLRAFVAFVAAQPALLFGYALWGGMKEIAAAALLALLAALLAPMLRRPGSLRMALPAAVASGAILGTLSIGGVVWLAPLLVPTVVVLGLLHGRAISARLAGVFAGAALLLAIPSLVSGTPFVGLISSVGNLFGPLSKLQFFGIWPTGDFRLRPSELNATRILIAALIIAGLIGLTVAWRQQSWELSLYVAGLTIGCVLVVTFGSPWVDAKGLATACPAPVLAGMVGAAALFERRHRVEGVLLAGAIVVGVLWSNVLAYHDVTLAPRGQLAELATINEKFEGQGPTLLNEFSPYGARDLLRDMDPESPSELRPRPVPLRSGRVLQKGASADIDRFQLSAILVYRTLVLRRSGTGSRPPSIYRLAWAGRYYEVWQRPTPAPSDVLEHLSLGSRYQPAATPNCADVVRLARLAGHRGMLATVERPSTTIVELSSAPYSASLQRGGEDRRVIYLRRRTTLTLEASVPSSKRYDIWLGGSFLSRLSLSVDGTRLATRRHELNWPGQYTLMGEVTLTAGTHRVTLAYKGPDLHPGSDGEPPFGTGPLVLSPVRAEDLPVMFVSPARSHSLCAKRLDWIEALRG